MSEINSMNELAQAFAQGRANSCKHVRDGSIKFVEDADRYEDENGKEADVFTCDGCGGEFCSDCFGSNKCVGCEADEA